MTFLHPVVQILLVLTVLVAGIYDLRCRRIPNWLVLAGLLAGFAVNFALAGGLAGLGRSAKGLGLAFLIYFPLYLVRGMGAGDVKLMGAIGAIVGPGNWFIIFILSAILGGAIAVLLILSKGRFRRTLWNVGYILWELCHFRPPQWSSEELDVRNPKALTMPHGTVVALGSAMFLGIMLLSR